MVPSTNFNHELLQDFHLEELLDCRYYYGNLTEKESEEILKPEKYGTYLIRDGPIESKRDEDCPPGMVRGPNGQLWPAWVFCTRYSDRPSSGKYILPEPAAAADRA